VSYRPDRWLAEAITSVADQADQILVVDNGSQDAKATAIARAGGATAVRLDENQGFPGGVNAGLAQARGDVIALLNDDAVASPEWIPVATERLSASDDVAAVGPKLLLAERYAEVWLEDEVWMEPGDPRRLGRQIRDINLDGCDVLDGLLGGVHRVETGVIEGEQRRWRWTVGDEPIYVPVPPDSDFEKVVVNGVPVEVARTVDLVNNAGSYLSAEGHGGDFGATTPDDGQFDQGRECFAACGAALVTTARTLAEVGPFASSFFAYYEDLEWCWRARLGGGRIVYDPRATVRHVHGATSGGAAAARVRGLAARNRLQTLARNAPIDVAVRQFRATFANKGVPVTRLRAGHRLAQGFTQRASLRRSWRRSPREVWDQWAGVDEHWPHPGRSNAATPIPPRVQFGD
jgi:GT2 family glycosyltransferase